jgi:5-methylcytosine-specific restriction protein A
MAREFARGFYQSKAWRTARGIALRRDRFTCQECGGRAEEVHHVIELTPENIGDPKIALNPDNLLSLCHDCHTRETKGFTGDVAEGYMFDENGYVVPSPPGS